MDLHWQPVGPLPAQTYWLRRAGVLLAVLLVLYVATLPLGGGGDEDTLSSGSPTASPTAGSSGGPEPSAEPTPTPSASPTAEPEPCPDDALEVTASSDADSYPAGATAALTLQVRNTGTVPCRRALGQGAVELTVSSGDDRVWSSDDCAPGGGTGEVVLDPGGEQSARATWSTVRSAPGCPPDQPQAQPGTYRVTARVGELQVPGESFQVTG